MRAKALSLNVREPRQHIKQAILHTHLLTGPAYPASSVITQELYQQLACRKAVKHTAGACPHLLLETPPPPLFSTARVNAQRTTMAPIPLPIFFAALTASVVALLYNPVKLRAEVLGFTRSPTTLQNIHGEGLRIIPDTVLCEDLHQHGPSGLLFAGCQGRPAERYLWFPPAPGAILKDPKAAADSQGGVFLIDPEVWGV